MNFDAALPHHAAADQRFGGAEASAVNQNIDRAFNAVARDDTVPADFSDSIRDEVDVCAIKSRIIIVGNEDTFATQLIFRGERLAELGILDSSSYVAQRDRLRFFADGFVAEKSEHAKLLPPENILPKSPTG